MMKEYEEKFLKNYEIKVLNTSKRRARFRNLTSHASMIDNQALNTTDIESEAVFTLEIPESRLTAIMELEQRFFKFAESHEARNLFYLLMEREREETALRKQYPAVQKAYEQYLSNLGLVGYLRRI